MSRQDEISELILYVTEMRQSFTRKLDDQLFIIQQQNERIQRQSRTIDEQKEVVDELAWQIRDLRDAVRRVKENCSCSSAAAPRCVCCNCANPVGVPKPAPRRWATSSETLLLAEPISTSHTTSTSTAYQREPADDDTCCIRRRDKSFADAMPSGTNDNIYERISEAKYPSAAKLRTSLNPIYATATTTTTTTSATATSPDDRASERRTRFALFKHMTYRQADTMQPPDAECATVINDAINKLKVELKAERDSFLELDDELDGDVLLRIREQRRFPRSSRQRGSSKVVCSLVPDIEEDYLPPDEADTRRRAERNVTSDAQINYSPTDPKFPYGKGDSCHV